MPKGWPRPTGAGIVTDVNLIQYLGAACGPANPVDVDVVDRAARLLGIIYGTLGQLTQLVPADALAPGNALSVAGFNFVYNGATWDMVLEGAAAGSVLTSEAIPTAIIEGQVTLTGAAQQLPNEACLSVTLENPDANNVVAIGSDNAVTLLNGFRLQPGRMHSWAIDNVDRLWVIGTLNEIISYTGVDT